MTEMRIGVVGIGVVGGAVRDYLNAKGACLRLYDKYQGLGSLEEVNRADIIFVCVPTPYRPGVGLDSSAVEETILSLETGKIVVIKSTVSPGTTERLAGKFPQHQLFFNPEFLRESSALEDFVHPDRQIVGYCGCNEELATELLRLLPAAPYQAALPATAVELIKIATNAFLALKVTFANQIFDVADALGVDYGLVRDGVAADPRIGDSHLSVFDGGYRGYGGKCLPKDTLGLIDLAHRLGLSIELLEAADAVNQSLQVVDSGLRQRAA